MLLLHSLHTRTLKNAYSSGQMPIRRYALHCILDLFLNLRHVEACVPLHRGKLDEGLGGLCH
jgi:hypothetical protein